MDTPHTAKLFSLQWLRFFAAGSVLFYHASVYLDLMREDKWAIAFVPSWTGVLGVTLFFALSGYLMGQAMQRQEAAAFLLHRIVRIYPAFFLAVAVFSLSHLVLPIRPPIDWKALTLMPVGKASYPLGVEWTLVFEIAFYVFVFVIMAIDKKKAMPTIVVGWLGLILAHNIIWPDAPAKNLYNPFVLPFVGANVGFAAGMLLPVLIRFSIHPLVAAIIAVDLWLIGAKLLGIMGVRWGMGFGAALLVLSLARFRGWTFLTGDSPIGRLGGRLGDYSYALYLCHVPVIRTIYAVAPETAASAHLFWLAIILAPLISVALGEADLRLYRTLKQKVDHTENHLRWMMALAYFALFLMLSLYFGAFGGTP